MPQIFFFGCFGRPKAVVDAEGMKREALLNYSQNMETVIRATISAGKTEGYNHSKTVHDWDAEWPKAYVEKKIIEKAEDQKCPPSKIMLTADEVKKMIEDTQSWHKKILGELEANKGKVNQNWMEVEGVLAKTKKDLAIALEIQVLLDKFYDSGVPPELIQQAVASIGQIITQTKGIQVVQPPAPVIGQITK